MAPNITVPMNFGRHLLDSPTHSTLGLKAKNGATVRASSVILSFNSPVIDHMTTTLHLTSVDMEEFSEQAVRYFVDAAYSGETPPISRDMFRDINKMIHVFKVTWLVTRCSELFTGIAKAIGEPTYQDLVFLFDEAYFSFAKLKSREIVTIAFDEIRSANGEEEFISWYIKENLHTLSHQQMDLILELAGATNVQYVVKPLTQHLEDCLSKEDRDVSDNYKYLLDNSDLYLCQQNTPSIAEKLFDVLEQVCSSPESFKWVFQLHRKVMKKLVQPVTAAADVDPGSNPSSALPRFSPSAAPPHFSPSAAPPHFSRSAAPPHFSPSSAVVDPTGPCSETVTAAFSSDTTGHNEEEVEQMFGKGPSKESQPTSGDHTEYVSEIRVPDSKYNKIECKIGAIQQKTNTLVVLNWTEPCSNFRTVSISGNVKNCIEAEVIIHKIVNEGETRSIDIWVQTFILSWSNDEIRQKARDYDVRVDVTNIRRRDSTNVILTGLEEDIRSGSNYIVSLYM